MTIRTVPTTPFSNQKPSASRLRKKVTVIKTPHYLKNVIQSPMERVVLFNAKTGQN